MQQLDVNNKLTEITYDSVVHERRRRFIIEVSIFAIIVLFIYFVIDLYTSTNEALIFITILTLLFISLLYLTDTHEVRKLKIAATFLTLLAMVGVLYGALTDEVGDYGLFFFFQFPILAFFLLGKRNGLRWTLSFIGIVVLAVFLSLSNILFTTYSIRSWLYLGESMIVIVVMIIFYQDLIEASEKIIASRDILLAKERDQAKTVVTSIGEGLFVIDREGRVVSVNPAIETMLGMKSEAIINRELSEIFTIIRKGKPVPRNERPSIRSLATGKIITINIEDDVVCVLPSGRKFPVSLVSSPITHEGKVTGVVVVFRDVSTDKQASEFIEREVKLRTNEVREGEARLLASINSLNMGYIMTNHKAAVVMCNRAAVMILTKAGLINPADKITETSLHGFTLKGLDAHFGKESDLLGKVKSCLEDKQEKVIDNLIINNVFLRFDISAITLGDRVIGTVILLQDVTEVRVLERSKDELFSIASHELRTPLTAIRAYSALMKDKYKHAFHDAKLKAMIEGIHSSSVRLIMIVNDFLDTSRLEQKRITFTYDSFDLKTLVKQVIDEYQTLAEEQKNTLKLVKGDKTPTLVYADQDRTKQILINLVSNAIKFTQKGEVTLEFFADGSQVGIKVSDTGKGIVAQNQTLLFRKFQQAGTDVISRDASRGTGLGLYISKLLIESMGGKIWLESSQVGKGSTFAILLPKAK